MQRISSATSRTYTHTLFRIKRQYVVHTAGVGEMNASPEIAELWPIARYDLLEDAYRDLYDRQDRDHAEQTKGQAPFMAK